MRKLRVEWAEFEMAVEARSSESRGYLDPATGAVLIVTDETATELQELLDESSPDANVEELIAEADVPDWQQKALLEAWHVEQNVGAGLIQVADADLREEYRDLEDFIATLPATAVRRQLEQAIDGPGAFRRFRNVVHGTFRERELWFAFQAQRRREKATVWLAEHGIDVEWIVPQPIADSRPPPREHLLAGVLKFTRAAEQLPGVKRIALLGSLTRDEPNPKDADVLVSVTDEMDLTPLAKLGRQLAGHAQQLNRGADVFLADEHGRYIGRTCHWRDCAPGIRRSCDALHCGRRHYLHDDLKDVCLNPALVAAPPVELWPKIHARIAVPDDVERLVLAPLRTVTP